MTIKHIHLEEVDSTNRYLRDYRKTEGEDITFVWSETQTAGRGCGTNTWESEAGKNLTFSVLLHPLRVPAASQFIISMANALALREALLAYTPHIVIKWPNDIYWHDRKLAGTLIENKLYQGGIRDSIVGTGLNVNQEVFLSDAPNPVSLSQILGHTLDRDEVRAKLVDRLTHYFGLLDNDSEWATIRQRYHEALYRRNEEHRYRTADGRLFHATLRHVEDDGTLVLAEDSPSDSHDLRFGFKEVEFVIERPLSERRNTK